MASAAAQPLALRSKTQPGYGNHGARKLRGRGHGRAFGRLRDAERTRNQIGGIAHPRHRNHPAGAVQAWKKHLLCGFQRIGGDQIGRHLVLNGRVQNDAPAASIPLRVDEPALNRDATGLREFGRKRRPAFAQHPAQIFLLVRHGSPPWRERDQLLSHHKTLARWFEAGPRPGEGLISAVGRARRGTVVAPSNPLAGRAAAGRALWLVTRPSSPPPYFVFRFLMGICACEHGSYSSLPSIAALSLLFIASICSTRASCSRRRRSSSSAKFNAARIAR